MRYRIDHSSRVVIATHELFYGASSALRDYLLHKKIHTLLFLSHPILSENSVSLVRRSVHGIDVEEKRQRHSRPGTLVGYSMDFVHNLIFLVKEKNTFDIYIGVNPLNALVGLLLKAFGKVRYVIFYAIDFTPRRYQNTLLNTIYHTVESICVRYSDERWNVSPRIAEGRMEFLDLSPDRYKQKVTPVGLWDSEIEKTRIKKKASNTVVFVGHLLEKQGVQMVVKSLPEILKKIPKVKMIVIGGGEYEAPLKSLVQKLRLNNVVEFLGWIYNPLEVHNILLSCDIAVATYDSSGERSSNFTYYADPTKIKTYLSCCLPVVMTNVPYNATELSKKGCVVIVDYESKNIGKAILALLENKSRLAHMSTCAYETVKYFTWDKIFDRAFLYDQK